MSSDAQFRREVLEFDLGAPDRVEGSGLAWLCGCRATEAADGEFTIQPCAEHAPEFDESH